MSQPSHILLFPLPITSLLQYLQAHPLPWAVITSTALISTWCIRMWCLCLCLSLIEIYIENDWQNSIISLLLMKV